MEGVPGGIETEEQIQKVKGLLREFSDVFAENDFDLGHFDAVEHTIDTGSHPPIKQRMRRPP